MELIASRDAVTRVDLPTQSRTQRVAMYAVDAVGPTPVPTLVHRELVRLAEVWDAESYGWTAYLTFDGRWLARAYVGREWCVVATATRSDLRVAIAALLGELMAVSL